MTICSNNYYYEVGPPEKFICNKCNTACKTCTVMNSATGCTSCNEIAGYFLQLNSNNYCNYACLSGQYSTSTSPKRCMLCDSNCLKCVYSAPNCTLCGLDSFGKQMYLSPLPVCNSTCGIRTCLTSCPPKYYVDTNNKICAPCATTCLTCINSFSNGCLSCGVIAGQQYYLNLNNKTCTSTCTINYYIGPSSTYQCNQCDISCRTCSVANSNTNCLACN